MKLVFDFPTETIIEGKAKVLVPRLKAFVKRVWEYAPSKAPVFYNPVMELNRDLAVLALQAFQKRVEKSLFVCEPLTGCGLRGIRFALEVEGVGNVVLNDISSEAVKLARFNVEQNNLSGLVVVRNLDANMLLARHAAPRRRFDFIDLDPFGSPVPYLDSALRALRDGGLLALTATDMAPLCGVHPKACLRKYGGKPLRSEYCHELAVRLLAGCLASMAAKHDIGINVLFSHSTDHYIRIYVTIHHGAKRADRSLQNMGYVLHCFQCFHRETVKELFSAEKMCGECGFKLSFAGPLWLGKIFDADFVVAMEKEAAKKGFKHGGRIEKLLSLAREEANALATYFVVDKFCDKLGLPTPALKTVISELKKEGFTALPTHFNSKGFRTNAPAKTIKMVLSKLA
jgi:tRNA (guanine26-N2/guanine27-N2)-dimethyltransferase